MNTSDFQWSLIQSFLAALEHGSLMGAAKATGVSQPTLGRHIAELESQLDLLLFERTGRGLLPTPNALALADAARHMHQGASLFSSIATGVNTTLEGRIRISASQPVACCLLPPILARMRHALPDVVVELVVSNAVSNLLQRDADIALRMVRPEQVSLVAKRIGKVQIQACASKIYLQRKGTPTKVSDLLKHDLIGSDSTQEIETGFHHNGLSTTKLRFALRTDDLMAQWAAIQSGMGVGFAAQYLIASDASISPLMLGLKLPVFPIWLTVHRELKTSAKIRAVYDFLTNEVPIAL